VQPRLALGLALACAALAISAVAVDLAYELEAHLDSRDGDGWRTISTSAQDSYAYPGFANCAGPEMRLRVHNDRLLSADVRVQLSYSSGSEGNVILVDETWHLARGETRTHEFTIPDSAFTPRTAPEKAYVSVNAQVDSLYLGACVEEAS
jgi:hypothetical protein